MGVLLMSPSGEPVNDPSEEKLREVLKELKENKDQDAEVMISDDHGWTISFYSNGTAILQNLDMGIEEKRQYGLDEDQIIELWKKMQDGNITDIKKEDWS